MNMILKQRNGLFSKKKPCDNNFVYNGPRPVFKEVEKAIYTKYNSTETLEDRLGALFKFLFVSNNASTIQEIDLIVKNELNREPRKTFYFPSIGPFMRISHLESYLEYRDRIFSKKIVHEPRPRPIEVKPKCISINHPVVCRTKIPGSPKTSGSPKTPPSKKELKRELKKEKKEQKNSFIVVSESENTSDSESDRSESESDIDSNKDDSDYSDNEENLVEYEDYSEDPEEYDYSD